MSHLLFQHRCTSRKDVRGIELVVNDNETCVYASMIYMYVSMTMNCIHDILREESSQTPVILQYKLMASILSAVCSVIQQS